MLRRFALCEHRPRGGRDAPARTQDDQAPFPLRLGRHRRGALGRRRAAPGRGCARRPTRRRRSVPAASRSRAAGTRSRCRSTPTTTPIASGLNNEKGPLNVFNWSDYVNPAVVKKFEKEYGVKVKVTTFENEEEALAKLTSGHASFDVWFATVEYLSRAVAGKLIQPVNHSYLPNLKNVWPSLESPFYDVHSRYSVPYTVYTTGIAWRKDKIKTPPTAFKNGYDAFWHAQKYRGQGRDPRRPARGDRDGAPASRRRQRQHREREARGGGRGRPEAAHEDRQREDEHDAVHGRADRRDVARPGVVGRHGGRDVLHAEGRARQRDRLLASRRRARSSAAT